MPWPLPARPLPTGLSRQGSPSLTAVPRQGTQAGCLAMSTPPCFSVPPAMCGGDGWWGTPPAARPCCMLARLQAAVTAQRLHASALASWAFSRASGGASGAAVGGKVGLRWAWQVPGGCLGSSQPWLGTQGGHHRVFGGAVPTWEHHTHHGTWRSRDCPCWRGWHRRPGGTPGAGSVSPLTAGQKEGLSVGAGGMVAPRGMVGPHSATPRCSPTCPQSTGDWHGGTSPSPGAT